MPTPLSRPNGRLHNGRGNHLNGKPKNGNGQTTNGQHAQLLLAPWKAKAADIKELKERIDALANAYEKERQFDAGSSIETHDELKQAQSALRRIQKSRAERLASALAKRRGTLQSRQKRPTTGLLSINFELQATRNAFFKDVVSDPHFHPAALNAAKRLGRRSFEALLIRLGIKESPLDLRQLFFKKEVERRPEETRTVTSDRKYAEAVKEAAGIYSSYAAFYEWLAVELARAAPNDPATKEYEQQLAKLKQKMAMLNQTEGK